jgi:hypothetical protein
MIYNLDGKKGHLDGTSTALGRRLSGRGESQKTLIQLGFTEKNSLTWTDFQKNIYKRMRENHES